MAARQCPPALAGAAEPVSLGSAAGTPDLKQKNHPLLPQEFSAVWFREVQGQRCKARADVHRAPGP